jgi:hypothetical protein
MYSGISFFHATTQRGAIASLREVFNFRNFHQNIIMKKIVVTVILFSLLFVAGSFNKPQSSVTGAWHAKNGDMEQVLVFQGGYFSCTMFDKDNKKFVRSFGGVFSESGGQLHVNIEFDTELKDNVGKHTHFTASVSGNSLKLNVGTSVNDWTRKDDGSGALAGNWRITGRMNNGQMQPMQPGARKTVKLLSGSRFQWMAINPETKEFFGTGGGTYTFKDGKYTENIEFFSRDSSRVGASLTFDGSVNKNIWTHKGLSSKGDPIHEEWTKEL